MKQLLNFIPLIFFFVFLTMYDIFAGVQALMISATIAFLIILVIYRKIDKVELLSYLMIMIFGGFTLYTREPNIIKWKVTIINFIFASALLISQFIFKKNLLQKMLGKELQLNLAVWNRLNLLWIIFFISCGVISLITTYYAPDEFFWIFKVFILPGASLLLSLISGIYIYRNLNKHASTE
ncbi:MULTISPECIES: inner membrane-spanning protein YciB [unclassified Gilliamella]|uniref:inner membrane-spanning protein YciB n=1 Tax=unclassified Gilliamella TaxID=2685620 RepID=UPI00226A27B2|nr:MULTISPECIES: inner membrane-spanning protein YciB [unclassified Gilliamella]MCX8641527.1 septation protein IspZ [Gilliamella sp. B3835]MCX8706742.1 septation protein IspZ [Gilliamella sp. B3783]MCX8708600.1 septation protein IspZ [Gilliamella sp. B3780]MCX8711112.1 septation protein IspZ [Gilliamella sp. B3468]MCX8713869.1 septation protein IspZ [Gilliamella sp. B3781]